jgi:hypothetical protein
MRAFPGDVGDVDHGCGAIEAGHAGAPADSFPSHRRLSPRPLARLRTPMLSTNRELPPQGASERLCLMEAAFRAISAKTYQF